MNEKQMEMNLKTASMYVESVCDMYTVYAGSECVVRVCNVIPGHIENTSYSVIHTVSVSYFGRV